MARTDKVHELDSHLTLALKIHMKMHLFSKSHVDIFNPVNALNG